MAKQFYRTKENYGTWILPFCLFSLLLLSACGSGSGPFKLEGRFKNMNQAQLFLYDIESGRKDTIEVRDGRFEYETAMTDTTTLILLFPNYSELPILARPGTSIEIEGDVSNLKETEITGSDENEELTDFRKKTNNMTPQQAKEQARRYISEHPKSMVCAYLLRRFFILSTTPDYDGAYQLCTAMLKASPRDRQLIRLHHQLNQLKNQTTNQLPTFAAVDTKGDTITNSRLKATANVIVAWANWDFNSQNALPLLRRLQKEHPDSIAVITVCLDATAAEGRMVLQRDSIAWPNICDGMLWQSPLVQQLGFASFPANIVADSTGNIVGRNLKNEELKNTINGMLHK